MHQWSSKPISEGFFYVFVAVSHSESATIFVIDHVGPGCLTFCYNIQFFHLEFFLLSEERLF